MCRRQRARGYPIARHRFAGGQLGCCRCPHKVSQTAGRNPKRPAKPISSKGCAVVRFVLGPSAVSKRSRALPLELPAAPRRYSVRPPTKPASARKTPSGRGKAGLLGSGGRLPTPPDEQRRSGPNSTAAMRVPSGRRRGGKQLGLVGQLAQPAVFAGPARPSHQKSRASPSAAPASSGSKPHSRRRRGGRPAIGISGGAPGGRPGAAAPASPGQPRPLLLLLASTLPSASEMRIARSWSKPPTGFARQAFCNETWWAGPLAGSATAWSTRPSSARRSGRRWPRCTS